MAIEIAKVQIGIWEEKEWYSFLKEKNREGEDKIDILQYSILLVNFTLFIQILVN